jgi:hypothetical protein
VRDESEAKYSITSLGSIPKYSVRVLTYSVFRSYRGVIRECPSIRGVHEMEIPEELSNCSSLTDPNANGMLDSLDTSMESSMAAGPCNHSKRPFSVMRNTLHALRMLKELLYEPIANLENLIYTR